MLVFPWSVVTVPLSLNSARSILTLTSLIFTMSYLTQVAGIEEIILGCLKFFNLMLLQNKEKERGPPMCWPLAPF